MSPILGALWWRHGAPSAHGLAVTKKQHNLLINPTKPI